MIAVFGPTETRAIYDDDYPMGVSRRASLVEPIADGLMAGWWFADMSPLGDGYQYCLWPPYRRRDEALAAEREHLAATWLME
jgi:hypothetical protein